MCSRNRLCGGINELPRYEFPLLRCSGSTIGFFEESKKRTPDFEHTISGANLSIDSHTTPKWVADKLRWLENPTPGSRARFKRTNLFHSDGKNTKVRNKRLDDTSSAALLEFDQIVKAGSKPTSFQAIAAARACGSLKSVDAAKRIHTYVESSELWNSASVRSSLVDMYSKCGKMAKARAVLDTIPCGSVVAWNCLIQGYVHSGDAESALRSLQEMEDYGFYPSRVSFLAALKACAKIAEKERRHQHHPSIDGLERGKLLHAKVCESGLELDVLVANSLIDMYSKCGSIIDARTVFDKMPHKTLVSWTAMIQGYANSDGFESALELYAGMVQAGFVPDTVTYLAVLKACVVTADKNPPLKERSLETGRAIHCQAQEQGLHLDIPLASSLVDMYAKCGSLDEARRVFQTIPHRDSVAWTAVILACVKHEKPEMAMEFYWKMRGERSPDAVTFVAVLQACARIADLDAGRELEREICNAGLHRDVVVANSLVDFYGKCGSMSDAQRVFDDLPAETRSIVTWNSLIDGYGRQGDARQAFSVFDRLLALQHIVPNDITFLSILTLCSHRGLIEEAEELFRMMTLRYKIPSSVKHVTVMIDLLARANRREEAFQMMRSAEASGAAIDTVAWTTLLNACSKSSRTDADAGNLALREPSMKDDPAAYVLLANMYSGSCHATAPSPSRSKSQPGSAWTDDNGGVHRFMSGVIIDHPQEKLIMEKLGEIFTKLARRSILDNGQVQSGRHSEIVAIACALINTANGTPIRISKDLESPISEDCHRLIALVSKQERRTIICRDTSGFHVFNDGKCCCGD